jgi:hypothetical protein
MGGGWKYACDDIVASIADSEDRRGDAYMDGVVAGLRASLSGDVTTTHASYELAGHRGEGTRLAASGSSAGTLATADAALLMTEKGSRVLTCAARDTGAARKRCEEALRQLASSVWLGPVAAGATPRAAVAKIAGRTIEVPAGCEVTAQDNAGVVNCAHRLVLTWVTPASASARDAVLDQFVQEFRRDSARGRGREEPINCKVEGTPAAECRRFVFGDAVVYVASAVARGQLLVAMCSAESIETLSEVCALSFEVPRSR